MLFCADQMSTSSLPVKTTPALNERWNALPHESKKPYHRQAIIVNTKSEEGDNDNHHGQITYVSTSRSHKSHSAPVPPPPRQLISPEAMRSVEQEEKEEALGQQPFSAYSSFLSMKYSHEQQRSMQDDIQPSPVSLIPTDQSPTLTRSSTTSPSPTSSSIRNYLNLPSTSASSSSSTTTTTTATSMTTSNLLPPPILQQIHPQNSYNARYLSDRYYPQQQQQQQQQQQYRQQDNIPDDKSQAIPISTCPSTKNMQITTGYSQIRDIETGTVTTSLDSIYNNATSSVITSSPSSSTATRKRRSGSATSITFERLKRPPNAYLLFNRDMRRKLLALDPKLTVSEISKEIGERWKYLTPNERQHYIEAAQALKTDHLKNHPDFIYTRRSKAELAEAKRTSKAGRKKSTTADSAELRSMATTNSLRQSSFNSILPSSSSLSPPQSSLYSQGRHPLIVTDEPLLGTNGNNLNINEIPNTTTTSLSPDSDNIISLSSSITNHQGKKTKEHQPSGKKRGRRRSENGQRDPRGRKKKRHKHPTAPKHPMSGFLFFLGAVRPEVAQQFPGSTVGPISKEISSRWKNMSAKEREPWLLKAESDKARYAREMQTYMATMKQQEQQQQESPNLEPVTHDLSTPLNLVTDQGHGNNNGHGGGKRKHVFGGSTFSDDDAEVNDQMIAAVVQMVNSGNGPRPLSSGPYPSDPPPSYTYSHPSSSILPLGKTSPSSVYNSPTPLNKPSNIVPL
ncbi:hypothetical protein BC941DRAFT_136934 [Chlamydoabsidia padenii]|nr:hypothetical protein BC941DRAFT_136934 [Chlamydoabsidia padenii]